MAALSLAFCVLAPVTALGQGTVMPIPLAQWLDNTGAVLNGGALCVFRAGTSTLATTYTTAALSVANANPIPLNSAGRPTSGGVFLTPGESYKFVLKDATVTTCVPDTGVTIWSVDNVSAVPGSASAVDVTATAAESIAAGDVVFVATGAGGLTQGQLYKTDADLTYKSTATVMVGIAPNAITAASSGTIRISGTVTVPGPLSTGQPYYASATPGALAVTPPTNAIRLGLALSATSLIVGYTDAPVSPRGPPCGRLTLTSGTPVTTGDVTAATTLYYTPAGSCNTIALYDGTAWDDYAFAELSIAVPATTSQMYDVFVYDNAGVVALELTAWTNDTTRATALALQNGIYVKTGALTRRYLGSFRTTGVSGQTEDSVTKRYVWNYYNRASRLLRVTDGTNTWAYSTATIRQANGSTANQVDVVVGVAGALLDLRVVAISRSTVADEGIAVGIGEDSTTAMVAGQVGMYISTTGTWAQMVSHLHTYPTVGRHFYAWLERGSGGAGTVTWIGDNGLAYAQTGLIGFIDG